MQIGLRRATTVAIIDHLLSDMHTFLIAGVVICWAAVSRLLTGLNEEVIKLVARLGAPYPERPGATAGVVCTLGKGFHAFEIGQHVPPAPRRQPLRRPAVEIERI